MSIIRLNITLVYSSIEMTSKTTTLAFVILALTAAVMLSSMVVLIPQANAAKERVHFCHNIPNQSPPCNRARAR